MAHSTGQRNLKRAYKPVDILGSLEADDMQAYFRELPALMGVHARSIDGCGGGVRAEDVGWKSKTAIDAAGENRRILAGLSQLGASVRHALELGWVDRRRAPELELHFGEHLVNVAIASELIGAFRLRYPVRPASATVETWLIEVVKSKKGIAEALRDHAQTVLGGALSAYGRVRVREATAPRKARQRAAPVRREVGLPFLPGGL